FLNAMRWGFVLEGVVTIVVTYRAWRISHTYDTFEVIHILAGQILIFAAMAGYPKVRETCTVANVYVDVALWLAYNFGLCFFDGTDTFVAAIHGVSSMPPMLSLPLLMTCDDSDGCDDDTYVVRSFQAEPAMIQRMRRLNQTDGNLTPQPSLKNNKITTKGHYLKLLGEIRILGQIKDRIEEIFAAVFENYKALTSRLHKIFTNGK
ncbi:hypothetical protein Tco_1147913, partial [Tanacetum coccineum]